MAKILTYPTTRDIDGMYQSIKLFLTYQRGSFRDLMLAHIRYVLTKYRISKYNFKTFSVHINSGCGNAFIFAKEQAPGVNCPGCGAEIFSLESPVRIISICEGIRDRVTYGCRCGKIFYRLEKK